MRKLKSVVVLLLILVGLVFGQGGTFKFAASIDPVSTLILLSSGFGLAGGGEYKLSEKDSVGADIRLFTSNILGISANALSFTAVYRYYLESVFSGGYFGGGAGYVNASLSTGSITVPIGGFAITAIAGWKFSISQTFYVDPYVVYTYVFANSSSILPISIPVGGPGFGVYVGYLF